MTGSAFRRTSPACGKLLMAVTILFAAAALGQNLLEGIATVTVRRETFAQLDQIEATLPMGVLRDEAGVFVLRTTHDCVPVYLMDTSAVVIRDEKIFVNAKIVAEAVGCKLETKKRETMIACAGKLDSTRAGGAEGKRAPGFRLLSENNTLITLDSLRARGAMIVLFVRSAEWDPVSKSLLHGAREKLDSLRAGGFSVTAIHGYESAHAKKWADSLRLGFPLLADRYSAVMRGYEVFDRGSLPYPALFVIDERGIIRLRREWREYGERVDWGEIMRAISEER